MKIFDDKEKQLDLHPLKVYFMLSSKDSETYKNFIGELNDNFYITRGLFQFQIIERVKCGNTCLSDELASTLKRYNVLVRLVDNNEEGYHYALYNLRFSEGKEVVKYRLQEFVVSVCKNNIKLLESMASEIDLEIEDSGEIKSSIRSMVSGFKVAMDITPIEKHSCVGDSFASTDSCSLSNNINWDRFDDFEKTLNNARQKELFAKIRKELEDFMESVSDEDSEIDATDAFLNGLSKSHSKNCDIDIKIEIKRTSNEQSMATGSIWGLFVYIDGMVVPVYFKNNTAAIFYIATLIYSKFGKELERNRITRGDLSNWLKKLYYKVFPGVSRDSEEWYEGLKKNGWHALSQGKSQAITKIKQHLKGNDSAIECCKIQTSGTRFAKFYYINVPRENIAIPEDFAEISSKQIYKE